MSERLARCRCGQLTAECRGEPVRVSVCHCQACQRRTGGVFSAQARFPVDAVTLSGAFRTWERIGGSGRRAWYRWCPECGATVAYTNEGMDGVIAIPLGGFAGGEVPRPTVSVFEEHQQDWLAIVGADIEHFD
ncbi:GFA family protein [Sphingomonas sp. KR1UV-12]|uniref:GFA family protein n=1 Tax=Sphingomonas aurea TaxID=3063994 RepID=A0ABT9EG58_9SPHN|nr:GFA family protein [Sphingomonas sp. KR1UV-12]MDP1025950.1 GFA family protein [Sphingomonas sp. KR1UV-12]